jgi:hypothetical protein
MQVRCLVLDGERQQLRDVDGHGGVLGYCRLRWRLSEGRGAV